MYSSLLTSTTNRWRNSAGHRGKDKGYSVSHPLPHALRPYPHAKRPFRLFRQYLSVSNGGGRI